MLKDSKVYLAPLEGLADGPMREVLCAHGGYDLCFSEFIRITDLCVSEKTLIREIPEFLKGLVQDLSISILAVLQDLFITLALCS